MCQKFIFFLILCTSCLLPSQSWHLWPSSLRQLSVHRGHYHHPDSSSCGYFSVNLKTKNTGSNNRSPNLQDRRHASKMICHMSRKLPSDLTSTKTTSRRHNRDETESKCFTVEVSLDGRSCQIQVQSNETLLAAMERAGVSDRLAIPEVPSECKRGNCLTCTGRHLPNSRISSLVRGDDGLSPSISKQVAQKGYVLTCSSHVVGNGVKLQLGENHQAWKDVYQQRFLEEEIQILGRAAMAKTIRMRDERNLTRWAKETERALKKSENE